MANFHSFIHSTIFVLVNNKNKISPRLVRWGATLNELVLKGSCSYHLSDVVFKVTKFSLQTGRGAEARVGARARTVWVCPGRIASDGVEVEEDVESCTQSSQRRSQMQNQHLNSKLLSGKSTFKIFETTWPCRHWPSCEGTAFHVLVTAEHQESCWRTYTSQRRNVWQF